MPLTLLLHGQHEGPTVRYEPFGPWLVPWRYTTFDAEYAALRTGALSDVSLYALIEVPGRDRLAFLHNLLSQDIKRLQPGQGTRTALLDPVAKMLGEMLVLALPETCWLLCPLDEAPVILSTLEKYVFSEDVRLLNRERPYAALALHGPAPTTGAPCSHREASVASLPVREISFSPFGIPGVLYLVEAHQALALWEALRARPGVQPAGWEALTAARLEAGVPWYGIDIDATHLLPETGLETMLASDNKGCYPGQEIVARMATSGSANKKLMRLMAEDEKPLEPGSELRREGESVGRVTSAAYSPQRRRWLAFGYVKRGFYEPGTMLGLADVRAVTVLDKPGG